MCCELITDLSPKLESFVTTSKILVDTRTNNVFIIDEVFFADIYLKLI